MLLRLMLIVSLLTACQGQFSLNSQDAPSDGASENGGPSVGPTVPGAPEIVESAAALETFGADGLRRLTQYEVLSTLEDTFGIDAKPFAAELPNDVSATRFDNGYESQTLSSLEAGEYMAFAEQFAAAVANDDGITERLGNCTPTGPDDADCLASFAQAAGTSLFRRPVTDVTTLVDRVSGFSVEDGDFATGVELTVTYFLVHPEFLYRTETADGLTEHEIAARLAYFVWGRGPDAELLAAADRGELSNGRNRAAHAQRLLEDDRAKAQWARFHAMWLGYDSHNLDPDVADDMIAETNTLVLDVMFRADWLDILRADETYVTPELAAFYGLDVPADTDWVTYDNNRGGGVLSHATVLNHGYKGGNFQDTSPTLRGYELFKRFTCGTVGEAPGSVDPDRPPGSPGDCKADAYTMRDNPDCASCHVITDGIGFGLENYDKDGVYRSHEPLNGQCEISGEGSFLGAAFSGPRELGELLAENETVRTCANTHLFRFLTGRQETPDDLQTLEALTGVQSSVQTLADTIIQIVATDAFVQHNGGPQ